MATAEFSKFADILSAALSLYHLLGFEIAQLEFHNHKQLNNPTLNKTQIILEKHYFPFRNILYSYKLIIIIHTLIISKLFFFPFFFCRS